MMMPESSKINIDDFGSSRLLNDIQEISKALYLHDAPFKYVKQLNHKKSSIWKWKPLKALTNHKLNSTFFLHIHSIQGLPFNFNDLNLRLYWKTKHEVLKTHSIRVKQGVADFEETLIHPCSLYVSKTALHHDVAKYAPKLSLLYASIVGAPNLDIGKHWIDLTRLLPLTLMDLQEEKNRYGKWVTSFKLTGKAKGAKLNVCFGFSLSGDNFIRPRAHMSSLPYEGPSISQLYELLDDDVKTSYSKDLNSISNEVYDGDFAVIDKGVEFSEPVESCCIETIDVAELFDDEVCSDFETKTLFDENSSKENNNMCTEESNEELELFLHNLSISESRELDFSFHENQFLENVGGKMVKSCSLDDLTSIVIDDFMNLVGFDSEPESPRELLLRQFEKETLASGNLFSDFDNVKEDQIDCCNIFDSSFLFQEAEIKHDYDARPSLISRRKAKMLENLETETLMEKWGLNERAFQNTPRTESGAFGSPVYLSPERPHELPPLGDGLGSFLMIQNGGFLRSIYPFLFRKAKNGEKLIFQVSNSVVLPLAMGSNGMDILLKWATVGPEKMLCHATNLMPIEEVTGKTLQQAAWKAEFEMKVLEREHTLLQQSYAKETPTNISCEINSEYVSVENIIPLAMEKIQYLLIEGLRIQSGMSNEAPPSTINPASTINIDIEELVNMSISFEDWIKLESDRFDPDCGYFGKSMLALQMLLRDPLRDYEPVGIPMLALIEVGRSTSVDPMFIVNEVHVTGFKADFQKKQLSGSRWLHSSGMTSKMKRHLSTKSTAVIRSSIQAMNKEKHEATLWSMSSYIYGDIVKWKELSGAGLFVRNPDIVFK